MNRITANLKEKQHYNFLSDFDKIFTVPHNFEPLIYHVNKTPKSRRSCTSYVSLCRFMLMTQSLPRRMKVKGVRGDKEVGVTCISYHTEDKDMFLVGSEAGVIFKCSMNSQGPPAGSKAF